MSRDDSFIQPLIPMTYSQALKWLGFYCTLRWKSLDGSTLSNSNAYTVHALKLTMSWANQLAQQGLVTEEQRHLQSHHRRGEHSRPVSSATHVDISSSARLSIHNPTSSWITSTFARTGSGVGTVQKRPSRLQMDSL